MYSELSQAQKKHQIALEVLSYHCVATDKEVDACADAAQETVLPEDFYRYVTSVVGRQSFSLDVPAQVGWGASCLWTFCNET